MLRPSAWTDLYSLGSCSLRSSQAISRTMDVTYFRIINAHLFQRS